MGRCNPCESLSSSCALNWIFSGLWIFPGVLASIRGSSWFTIPMTYASIATGVAITAIWNTPAAESKTEVPTQSKNAFLQCDCHSHSTIDKNESLPSKALTSTVGALKSARGRNAMLAVRVWAEMGPGMPWILRQADEVMKVASSRIRRHSSCTIPCIRLYKSLEGETVKDAKCTIAIDLWPERSDTSTATDAWSQWAQSAICIERDGLPQLAYPFTPPIDLVIRYCVRGSLLPGPFIALYRANIPSLFPPEPLQSYWIEPEAKITEVRWITSLGPRPLPHTALALVRAAGGPRQTFPLFNPEVEEWKAQQKKIELEQKSSSSTEQKLSSSEEKKSSCAEEKKSSSSEEKKSSCAEEKKSSSSEEKKSSSAEEKKVLPSSSTRKQGHDWTRHELQTWIGTNEFAPPMTIEAIRGLDDKRYDEKTVIDSSSVSDHDQLRIRVSKKELRERARLREIASAYEKIATDSKCPLLLVERSDGSNSVLADK